MPLLEQKYWVDTWLLEQFLDWLDGGPPMATNIEANLQSVALIFSAIESSRTGQPVKVQEFLQAARDRERVTDGSASDLAEGCGSSSM